MGLGPFGKIFKSEQDPDEELKKTQEKKRGGSETVSAREYSDKILSVDVNARAALIMDFLADTSSYELVLSATTEKMVKRGEMNLAEIRNANYLKLTKKDDGQKWILDIESTIDGLLIDGQKTKSIDWGNNLAQELQKIMLQIGSEKGRLFKTKEESDRDVEKVQIAHNLKRYMVDLLASGEGEISVGRLQSSKVIIPEKFTSVSRYHFKIYPNPENLDTLLIENLSQNGTMLNDRSVESPIRVKFGDVIQFGELTIQIPALEQGDREKIEQTRKTTKEAEAAKLRQQIELVSSEANRGNTSPDLLSYLQGNSTTDISSFIWGKIGTGGESAKKLEFKLLGVDITISKYGGIITIENSRPIQKNGKSLKQTSYRTLGNIVQKDDVIKIGKHKFTI